MVVYLLMCHDIVILDAPLVKILYAKKSSYVRLIRTQKIYIKGCVEQE